MNTEQERAEFEAWVSGRNVVKKYGAKLYQTSDGNYKDYRLNDRWMAWQARAALQSQELEDADRYRYLLTKLQQTYDGECLESERLSIYCRMSSQFKGDRTIQAEITWRDKTDEAIGLGEAIDHARRVEGESR